MQCLCAPYELITKFGIFAGWKNGNNRFYMKQAKVDLRVLLLFDVKNIRGLIYTTILRFVYHNLVNN